MTNAVQKSGGHPTVALLQKKEEALAKIVGQKNMAVFMGNVLSTLRKDGKLLQCSPDSFYSAAHQAAILGLQPGPLGHVYLVPYGKTATLITGYKGLMELARRHPDVRQVEAKLVFECEMDDFEFDQETNKVTHKWRPGPKTEETFVACYSRVWMEGSDRPLVLVFERDQVEARRSRSKAAHSNFWKNDWLAMARKTVIRAHYNGGEVPVSRELKQALEHEDEIEKKAEVLSVSDIEEDRTPLVSEDDLDVEITISESEDQGDSFGLGEPERPAQKKPGVKRERVLSEIGNLGLGDADILEKATSVVGKPVLDIATMTDADLVRLLPKLKKMV